MAIETAPAPQYQSPPATSRQLETIARFHKNLAIPKRQQRDTAGMTRQDASEYISELIQRMQSDEDEAPAAVQPTARELAAQQRERDHANEHVAQMGEEARQRAVATAQNTPPMPTNDASAILHVQQRQQEQGEWPPVPPQSSEAQRPVENIQSGRFTSTAEPPRAANSLNQPAPVAPTHDDPFAAPQGEPSWADLGASQLGDEDDEDDEIDLERARLAPVGVPLGFQVISSEKKQAGPSGYPGILVTAKAVAADEGVELGGTATEYLSLSPNARWKLDQFLDACNAPPEGKINYRQFVGWTFWAQATRDDYTKTTDSGDTQVTPKCVIDKYLEGPKIDAPTLNGTAPREKVKAQLGAEFS